MTTVNAAIIAIEAGQDAAAVVAAMTPAARARIERFDCDAAGAEWTTTTRVAAYWSLVRAARTVVAAPAPSFALPVAAPSTLPVLTCRRCGATGTVGAYPFSTNPRSGCCDDCC